MTCKRATLVLLALILACLPVFAHADADYLTDTFWAAVSDPPEKPHWFEIYGYVDGCFYIGFSRDRSIYRLNAMDGSLKRFAKMPPWLELPDGWEQQASRFSQRTSRARCFWAATKGLARSFTCLILRLGTWKLYPMSSPLRRTARKEPLASVHWRTMLSRT